MPAPNCPFYGVSMFWHGNYDSNAPLFVLMSTEGNQCALITNRFAPCWMEQNGEDIEWRQCPVARDIRVTLRMEGR